MKMSVCDPIWITYRAAMPVTAVEFIHRVFDLIVAIYCKIPESDISSVFGMSNILFPTLPVQPTTCFNGILLRGMVSQIRNDNYGLFRHETPSVSEICSAGKGYSFLKRIHTDQGLNSGSKLSTTAS